MLSVMGSRLDVTRGARQREGAGTECSKVRLAMVQGRCSIAIPLAAAACTKEDLLLLPCWAAAGARAPRGAPKQAGTLAGRSCGFRATLLWEHSAASTLGQGCCSLVRTSVMRHTRGPCRNPFIAQMHHHPGPWSHPAILPTLSLSRQLASPLPSTRYQGSHYLH
jgi:hypothetical protein